jgi:hypothetical protein
MMTDEELDRHIGKGWWPFVRPVLAELDRRGFKVVQIKEKFGYLRLYVDAPPDTSATVKGTIHAMIVAAESISSRTCEECGAEGQHRLVHNCWWKTWCQECFDKDQADRPELYKEIDE